MKSGTDEAVSTVIALMLVLAILATCIAIYSATYVPGLKQQSEILHSGEVQYAFLRLSSDVDNLYSLGKSGQFSEPVPLGGGDILLSPVKSSGTIELEKNQIGTISVINNDGGTFSLLINTTNITYTPSYSSWELQGYSYRSGVVWITKGAKETPADISLYTVREGLVQENNTRNQWLKKAKTVIPEGNGNYTMQIISMTPVDGKNFVTGTGTAKIRLNATEITEYYENVTSITSVSEDVPYPINLTVRILSIGVSVE
ncbi:hypothetical protein O0S10_01160 [Methanocorpusculum sp. MG]|uniref:Archaeal Type IV pilin N-terminal domain-containing protein n=1 Tax=Methanocorpusculum petauri TaxID=3002863 RepID=A0ABT4IFC2_9EURY|nr:hypothetical protein [Methanocorpusculum petauri]MCZ0859833.1 hypothetical protein [Methanocorpusculum petauri]